jgi:hypothetical protein
VMAVTWANAVRGWRDLFRSALVDQWEQNRRRLDYSLSQRDRDIAGRRRHEAETQLRKATGISSYEGLRTAPPAGDTKSVCV